MNGEPSFGSRLRGWPARRAGLLLALSLVAYLLGFFFYQAWDPADTPDRQEAVRYTVGDRCRMLIEYPARLRLGGTEQAGRPITVRLWTTRPASPDLPVSCSAALASTTPLTHTVQLGPVGAGLDYSDAAGQLVPATLSLRPALSESAAAPVRLYVRQSSAVARRSISLQLGMEMVDAAGTHTQLATLLDGSPLPAIGLESTAGLRLRTLAKILFSPGPLQWVFTALGGLLGVLELARGLQQKREERREKAAERRATQRERIAELARAESPSLAFHAYLALRSELGDDRALQDELRAAFQPEWLPYLRLQLGRALRVEDLDGALALIASMDWEWRQAADARTVQGLHALMHCLQQPILALVPQNLDLLLEGFRAAGLGATRPVVRRLVAVTDSRLDRRRAALIEGVFFARGGAGGRYLLSRWAEQDPRIQAHLKRWEREALPAVSYPARAVALWPRERGESRAGQAAVRALGLDFNPFGPEKAEQDPNLPDLFYCLPPVWDQMIAPRPSLVVAPPGSGRTALIWMARYESGLAGTDLELVFPVWVPIYEVPSAEDLARQIQVAIAAALCSTLARDPYALLGLDTAGRQGLADLLFRTMGGLQSVLRQLARAGMRAEDPDARLLQEALSTMDHGQGQAVAWADWDMPRLCPYGTDHTFLFVDAMCRDEATIETVLAYILGRWLAALAPRRAVAKVFVAAAPAGCALEPVSVAWDRAALGALLRHRLERAGLVVEPGRPALDGWVEGRDLESELLDAAAGSPARLVRLGNQLIDHCGASPGGPSHAAPPSAIDRLRERPGT